MLEFQLRDDQHDGRLLGMHPQAALPVARCLAKQEIPCAVFNSCNTGKAELGDQGNFSQVFVENGVSNVLNMSYKVTESMLERFYTEFYRCLLQEMMTFSEAASCARRKVEKEKERIHESPKVGRIDLSDWFVPVTYCDGREFKVVGPSLKDKLIRTGTFLIQSGKRKLLKAAMYVGLSAWLSATTVTPYMAWHASSWKRYLLWGAFMLTSSTALLTFIYIMFVCERRRPIPILTAEDLSPNILDKNMLRVENQMTLKERIYLYEYSEPVSAKGLIRSLVFVWRRTHFVDKAVIIPADWFLFGSVMRYIRHRYCYLRHGTSCCQGDDPAQCLQRDDSNEENEEEEGESKIRNDKFTKRTKNKKLVFPPDRSVVIITRIDMLYSHNMWPWWYKFWPFLKYREKVRRAGIRRLQRFLMELYGPSSSSPTSSSSISTSSSFSGKTATATTTTTAVTAHIVAAQTASPGTTTPSPSPSTTTPPPAIQAGKEEEKARPKPYLFFSSINKYAEVTHDLNNFELPNVAEIQFIKQGELDAKKRRNVKEYVS